MTGPVELEFEGELAPRPVRGARRVSERSRTIGRDLRVPAQRRRIRRHARGPLTAAGCDDLVVFNTCAVTTEAVRQARQAIRRAAARAARSARIVVTGCAAQVEPEVFGRMPEVDRVLGNADQDAGRTSWAALRDRIAAAQRRRSPLRETAHTSSRRCEADGRTRAFVEVQNGCDHRCTFCIIPFGRGASRSVPVGDVVEKAAQRWSTPVTRRWC